MNHKLPFTWFVPTPNGDPDFSLWHPATHLKLDLPDEWNRETPPSEFQAANIGFKQKVILLHCSMKGKNEAERIWSQE